MAAHQVANIPTWAATYEEWEHTHIVIDRTKLISDWLATKLQVEVVKRLAEMQSLSAFQGWDQKTRDDFDHTIGTLITKCRGELQPSKIPQSFI
jgi:hypothetical protein